MNRVHGTHYYTDKETKMAIPIKFDGQLGSPVGKTSFGYFDGDPRYINDAPKVADWIARKLGWPEMDIEIDEKDLYNAFEEAIIEFSSLVNELNIQDNLILLRGKEKLHEFENLTGKHVTGTSIQEVVRLAKTYGSTVGHGGDVTWRKSYIEAKCGIQRYDIKKLFSENRNASIYDPYSEIIIKKIYYYGPTAQERLYDPFSIGGVGLSGSLGGLGYNEFSASSQNLLVPAYHELLRLQSIEFNDYIRRSQYSYKLNNGVLTLMPIPNHDFPVWFDYVYADEADGIQVVDSDISHVVSDYSNVPYDLHKYENINQPSKRWIFKYARYIAMHKLGTVRSKFDSIPSPNDQFNLDGSDLIQNSSQKRDDLVQNLRERLEKLSRTNQLENQAKQQESVTKMLNKSPVKIYIG